MKKHLLNLILIILTGCIFAGCAGMTGVTNWKANTFVSPLGKDATVKIATEAIARIVSVTPETFLTEQLWEVCSCQRSML
jgi:hypothetical protein